MKSNSATASERRARKRGWTRILRPALAAAILAASALAWGAPATWRMDLQEDGIRVFSRELDGSPTRAIRAETDIRASVASTVALLLDASARPRWDDNCAEASVHERVSATEDVIYVHTDLPWPIRDRDMVLRRSWSIAPDGSNARIRTAAAAALMPAVDGRVRVTQADSVWTVVRNGASGIRLRTEIHADPGGPVPSWLHNSLSIHGPYQALRNIRALLESGADPNAAAVPH